MKISIITVVLNGVKTIERTIQSVLGQSFDGELEYILIDGGSTDGTLEIIERYKSQLSYTISEPDKGLYDAMNKGIAQATGDLVGIINADDYYLPNAFKLVSEQWATQPNKSDFIIWGDVQYEFLGRVKGFRPHNIYIGAFAPHPSMFVPLQVYQKMGVYDTNFRLLADYDFMYRAYHIEKLKVVYIPELIAFFSEGGLADSNILRCLDDERKVKHKNGANKLIANIIYRLKVIKNYRRIKTK